MIALGLLLSVVGLVLCLSDDDLPGFLGFGLSCAGSTLCIVSLFS